MMLLLVAVFARWPLDVQVTVADAPADLFVVAEGEGLEWA